MLVVFVIFVLSAVLLAPGLVVGPSLDAAVFVHVAGQLRDGGVLYVDAWDHKPPGVYLFYAAGQMVAPWLDGWLVAWFLSVLATAATGVAVAATLRRLGFGPWQAGAAALGGVVLMAQYLMAVGGGLTEPLAALPTAVALWLSIVHSPGSARMAPTGALLGVAVITALPLVPGGLAVAFIILARSPAGRRLPAALTLLAGGLVPIAAVVAWLALTGALPAAIDAVVAYGAAYQRSNAELGAQLSGSVLPWAVLASIFLLAPALLGIVQLPRSTTERVVRDACLGWIVLSVGLFVYQGRFFAHYLIAIAIPLAVLAAFGLRAAAARMTGPPLRRSIVVLPFVFALVVSLLAGAAGSRQELISVESNNTRMDAAVKLIRETTSSDSSILVWGNRPNVYEAAARRAATPFAYFYPLSTEGWATSGRVQAIAADLAADPPAIVVDAGSRDPGVAGYLPLLIPRPVADEGRSVDLLDPIRDFVRDRYLLLEIADGWPVYALRDSGVGS